jgi:hypothetical protein
MPHPPHRGTIEVVRDRLSPERAEGLLAFWARHGALGGAQARRRLAEVVCVLLGTAGEVSGASSVLDASVPLVGDQRFWVFRSLLPDAPEAVPAMVAATFAELEAEFDPGGEGPIGLCRLIDDPDELARRPEAEWANPRTFYAGYLPDGRQVRVAYFQEARLGRRAVGG